MYRHLLTGRISVWHPIRMPDRTPPAIRKGGSEMNRSEICALAAAILLLVTVSNAEDNVLSLRGDSSLDADAQSPTIKRWEPDQEVIARNFVQQPPLIPHSIEGYKIDQNSNKCLTCHSWANYRHADATKISQTHFTDRDDNELANVAPRRYFCTQCHVAQMDAKPLVENSFEPVKAIVER
jgi:cytochrome c-type protein NapB